MGSRSRITRLVIYSLTATSAVVFAAGVLIAYLPDREEAATFMILSSGIFASMAWLWDFNNS